MNDPRKTILVVDDEPHILHVVSLKLLHAGYQVITAENGDEGLAAARRHLPSLLITDYQMPFRTGLELCEAMMENASTSTIPCLLLTARGHGVTTDDLGRTRIAAVISKPFSLLEVMQRVATLIDGPPLEEASDAA